MLQWSHSWGAGWAVRLVEATSLSSPKRPCKEAGMHEETTRSTGWQGGRGPQSRWGRAWQRPPEMGALRGRGQGGQVSTPYTCKRGLRESRGLAGAGLQHGDPTSPPLRSLTPTHEQVGDIWDLEMHSGGGRADGRPSISIQNPLRKSN